MTDHEKNQETDTQRTADERQITADMLAGKFDETDQQAITKAMLAGETPADSAEAR